MATRPWMFWPPRLSVTHLPHSDPHQPSHFTPSYHTAFVHAPCLSNSNSIIKSQASLAQEILPCLPNQVKIPLTCTQVFSVSLYVSY